MLAFMTTTHITDITFASLDLAPTLVQGLADLGFHHCTPIQARALPLTLAGQDVLGQAQTGTGKTAAFLLAVMNYLLKHPAPPERKLNQPRALILAPTRELAIQIHKDALAIGKHAGLTLGLVYGGTGYGTQREQVAAGVDILIGTPGRIIDYFKQNVFDLRAVQVMVLDEADRMFDLGFIADVRFMLRRMPAPEHRLGMLFSATMPLRVSELAYEHMNNPQLISIEPAQVTARQIEEVAYYPSNDEKIPLLLGLLRRLAPPRTMLFVNTKRVAERVYDYLNANGQLCAVLSGDVPQTKRQQLLAQFQSGELPILVATDVAARGLHITAVTHVINFDLPQDAEDYVHRIGRTARAGASGMAISFVCEDYAFHMPDIEQYIGHKLPVGAVDAELLVPVIKPQRRPRTEGDRRHGNTARRPDGQGRQSTAPSSRPRTGGAEPSGARPRRRSRPQGGGGSAG